MYILLKLYLFNSHIRGVSLLRFLLKPFNMDREWMKDPNKVSPRYVAGVEEFIHVAQ